MNKQQLQMELALSLVQDKHYGMTYRSNDPNSMYHAHIVPVAQIIWDSAYGEGYNNDLIQLIYIAALLHDTVEDTDITVEDVKKLFGEVVADLVWRVTDEPGANRKEKKAATYPKISASKEATLIKLADRIINSSSSHKIDMYKAEYPEFRKALYKDGQWSKLWQRLDKNHDYIA